MRSTMQVTKSFADTFKEKPQYPQNLPAGAQTVAASDSTDATESDAANGSNPANEHYDVHQLARKGMAVKEISMGEFDEFLKGSSASDNSQ